MGKQKFHSWCNRSYKPRTQETIAEIFIAPPQFLFTMPITFGPNSGHQGYWGDPTSSIDWCESNYVVSFYIAEFWNTISSFLMVVAGICGLVITFQHHGAEMRAVVSYISIIF